MKCDSCGGDIPEDARYCASCGDRPEILDGNSGLVIFGLLFLFAGLFALLYWGYPSSFEIWASIVGGALSTVAGVYRIKKGMQ